MPEPTTAVIGGVVFSLGCFVTRHPSCSDVKTFRLRECMCLLTVLVPPRGKMLSIAQRDPSHSGDAATYKM